MRVFKSDGRFKLHSRGFHYIVEFRWHARDDKKLYNDLFNEFTDMYGPTRYVDKEKGSWIWNDNWRFEANAKAKRRRIYLKEETSLSMAFLKVGAQNGN